jgi:drug/metabolite transporter (DMT)-like permease
LSSIRERIGGYRRYLPALLAAAVGIGLIVWPGRAGSEDANQLFVALGSTIAVAAAGWLFLRLDRQVSDDPRYQRPVYTEDDDEA